MVVTNISEQHVFLVDDEPKVCKIIGRTLERVGLKVSCFARAEDCVKELRSGRCDLLITDMKMPGKNGMELLTEVKRAIPSLPVVVITGYGDVLMAVEALKRGASDFLEKPLERQSLLSAVESSLSKDPHRHHPVGKVLTRTERTVLDLILESKSTKEIALLLDRSCRTVEDHRNHIMRKLGVDNLIDLVKQVAIVRLVKLPEDS